MKRCVVFPFRKNMRSFFWKSNMEAFEKTPMHGPLRDSWGRTINYLRISLTEDCNFRCLYCLPPEGLPRRRREDYLSVAQILQFVRVAVGLGIHRVRLTGGEPLLREELVEIVSGLHEIPGLWEISLTTNGFYLADKAAALKKAGLTRINLSLDSMDGRRFWAMTRHDGLGRVYRGMEAALAVGFPLKLNVVILKGINEGEILSFAEFALDHAVEVRFLEFMPLCGSGWDKSLVYPVSRMRSLLNRHFYLKELPRGDAPAQPFAMTDGFRQTHVGFIGPLSEPFCDLCSRIRLSADGKIQPCLFSPDRSDIRPWLEGDEKSLAGKIREAAWKKSQGSQYAGREDGDRPEEYLEAYRGREVSNPLIHNIGG